MQGLLLEAPAVEPQWTLVLRLMAMVEDIFIHIVPGWLPIVPGPQPECHSPYPHVVRPTSVLFSCPVPSHFFKLRQLTELMLPDQILG